MLCQFPGVVCRPTSIASCKAKLLEHERLIKLLPALLYLAVHEAIDDQSINGDCLPRRRRRSERPCMCAGRAPPKRYPVVLNDLVLDREPDIGKGAQQACHEGFPGADAAKGLRDTGNVENTIRREG